jgi:hypothetical protein
MRNSLLLTLAVASSMLVASAASANPYASAAHVPTQNRSTHGVEASSDCDALRRSAVLRERMKPTDRRALIADCERSNQTIWIAANDPVIVTGAVPVH